MNVRLQSDQLETFCNELVRGELIKVRVTELSETELEMENYFLPFEYGKKMDKKLENIEIISLK